MPLWILVIFVGIYIASWGAFLSIQKNLSHVIQSHIRIMGQENAGYVHTRALVSARIIYGIVMAGFMIGSYVLLQYLQR